MPIVINPERRHTPACIRKHGGKAPPKDYKRCTCPIYAKGWDGLRKQKYRSLHTGDWREAEDIIRNELTGRPQGVKLVAEAVDAYVDELYRQNLAPGTIAMYRYRMKRLAGQFTGSLDDITPDDMRKFLARKVSPGVQANDLHTMRAFFQFCIESEWLARSPVRGIRPPKVNAADVHPFSKEELAAVLAACNGPYPPHYEGAPSRAAKPGEPERYRAFILLMRYSGLRVGDAFHCEKASIRGDRIVVRTQKKGSVVSVPLPPFVIEALGKFPHASERWYFWDGRAAVNSWVIRLRRDVFGKVPGAHSHRLRHTFVTEALKSGVPLHIVSKWAGHANVAVTARTYAAWTGEMQAIADEQMQRVWAQDELVFENQNVQGVQ
jgi:integrase